MKQGELARPVLEAARRGDARAFRALYDHHADAVHGFLWRMLRDDGAAEEALQDVFMRALGALRRFEPGGPARFSTWIFTIARRVALTTIERRGRKTAHDATEPIALGDQQRGERRVAPARLFVCVRVGEGADQGQPARRVVERRLGGVQRPSTVLAPAPARPWYLGR